MTLSEKESTRVQVELLFCFGPWIASLLFGLALLPTYAIGGADVQARDIASYVFLMISGLVACLGLGVAVWELFRGGNPVGVSSASWAAVYAGCFAFAVVIMYLTWQDIAAIVFLLPAIVASADILRLLRRRSSVADERFGRGGPA